MTKRDKLYLAGFLVLAGLLAADIYQTNQLSEQIAQSSGYQRISAQEDVRRVQQSINNQLERFREENGALLTKETEAVYRDGALHLTAGFTPRELTPGTTAQVEFWTEKDRITVPAIFDKEGTFAAEAEFPLSQAIQARVLFTLPDGTQRWEDLPEIWPQIIDGLWYSSDWESREDGEYLKFCICVDDSAPEAEDLADQIETVEMTLYTASGKKLTANLQKDGSDFWQERGVSDILMAFETDVTDLAQKNDDIEQVTAFVRLSGDMTFYEENVATAAWRDGKMISGGNGEGPLEIQWTN